MNMNADNHREPDMKVVRRIRPDFRYRAATVVMWVYPDNSVEAKWSVCSPEDNFYKAKGVKIAESRPVLLYFKVKERREFLKKFKKAFLDRYLIGVDEYDRRGLYRGRLEIFFVQLLTEVLQNQPKGEVY